MMRKTLTTGALVALVALAPACASTPTAMERGLAFHRDGQYLFAADEFTEATRLRPTSVAAYVNRGVARVRLGQLTAAIDDYNRALALDPRDPAIYFNRGNALVAAGHYGAAVQDFTRAVELAPAFARAWFNRGSARALAGETESAMTDWLHAVELEGDPWASAAMRRSAGLEPGTAVTAIGTPTTTATVAPPPSPGMATAAVPLPPPAALAATPPAAAPAASPGPIDARTLAMRAISRELDGDHEGALRDLRAALALEQDPARRQSLEALLRRLDTPQ
jgi:tetratricopeptide (TPR) repeat protein